MSLNELPEEVLNHIIYFLQRSPPRDDVSATRKDYHQQDLTVLLQVNKKLSALASKLLYTHPIVDDPYHLLLGINSSSIESFCKINLLKHVKYLDIQHKQSLRGQDEVTKYAFMITEEKVIWENNVIAKSIDDLDNCEKAYKLLEQLGTERIGIRNIMPNLETLRIGAYDEGWWVDKMKKILFHNIVERDNIEYDPWKYPEEYPKQKLSDYTMEEHSNSFNFAKTLLNFIQPQQIIQNIFAGPISLKDALDQHILPNSPIVISQLNFDIDRNTINFFPSIVIGSLNKWFIKCTQQPRIIEEEGEEGIYIDRNGLMVTIDVLLQHISKFTLPSKINTQVDTILEIYNIERLEYKEYDENGNIKLVGSSQWIGDEDDYALDAKKDYPTRICKELDVPLLRKRFLAWGMVELTREGIHFVDVRSEEHRFTVKFKSCAELLSS